MGDGCQRDVPNVIEMICTEAGWLAGLSMQVAEMELQWVVSTNCPRDPERRLTYASCGLYDRARKLTSL